MKKAIWFAAIGISSVTLLASVPLSQATVQLWNPEVARAAKVTAHLFKTKSLNPITLARQSRVSQPAPQPQREAIAPIQSLNSSALSASLRPSKLAQ